MGVFMITRSMKGIAIALMLCAGFPFFAKDINSPEVAVGETVTVTFKSIKDPVKAVKHEGKVYGPKDADADTMAEVVFRIANKGTEAVKSLNDLNTIELICADKEGVLSISKWSVLFETDFKKWAKKGEYNIEPNTTLEKTVYFVHPKKQTPVAFTQGRKVVCALYDEKTKNASIIAKNLVGIEKTPECFEMVRTSSSEDIRDFMNEYGITFKAEDMNGLTLLYHAIIFNNNDFLDLAIEQKSDLKHTVSYRLQFMRITPLQFAVLSGNTYAVDALIAAGEDLNCEDMKQFIMDIRSVVVLNNSLPGARILVAHGYDFSTCIVGGGGWSKKQTALEYAESKKFVELAEYLKSVTQPQGAE